MKKNFKLVLAVFAMFIMAASAVFADVKKANTSNANEKLVFASTEDDKALLSAAKKGDKNEVERILKAGVFVDVRDLTEEGNTALILAAGNGRKEVAEFLVANGAEIDARQIYHGRTALQEAAKEGNKDVAELLIKNGADVNAIAYHGAFVLDFAINNGYNDIAELLRKNGAVTGVEGYKIPKSYEKAHAYRTGKPYEKMKNVPAEIEKYRETDQQKFVTELCALIEREAKDEFEKVKMAHDYVACNMKYGSNSQKTTTGILC